MPPPWVMLHRIVRFIEAGPIGSETAILRSRGGEEPSLEEVAAALKPNPAVADPPEVTSLSVMRHLPKLLMQGMNGGTVSSTNRGLVLLYAGTGFPQSGGFWVYDASSGSLSAVPQLNPPLVRAPSLSTICSLGRSGAILRCRDGDYILAELVTSYDPGLPAADLYLWRSSSTAGGQWASSPSAPQWLPERQWVRKPARLPLPAELCGPTCFFRIDMAFAFQGYLCWVDLVTGVLICDLSASEDHPKFSFVPLPQQCCSYTPKEPRLALRPQEFCSMGCVSGAIKLVAMVGYNEGLPKEEVVLKTWTLSPDLKEWKEGPGVVVRDLWETQSYRDMKLPERGWPMNPVLSMNEDEVIYISLCDIEFVDQHDFLGECIGRKVVLNAHYVLRLDMLQHKVLSSKKSDTNCLSLLYPIVVASDFSAYLRGRKDSQRVEEASKVGTKLKRTRY